MAKRGGDNTPRSGLQIALRFAIAGAFFLFVLGVGGAEPGRQAFQGFVRGTTVRAIALDYNSSEWLRKIPWFRGPDGHVRRPAQGPSSSPTPTPTPTSIPPASPRDSWQPTAHRSRPPAVVSSPAAPTLPEAPGSATPGPSEAVPQLYISIKSAATSLLPGVSLGLRITWTPRVVLDGRVVTQGCRIYWTITNGTLPIPPRIGLCNQAQSLSLPIGVDHYSLAGVVMLHSGKTSRTAVDIPASGS